MSTLGKRFAREFVPIIPLLPQRQDSLTDQLDDLRLVATRLGMYDAATWVGHYQDIERHNPRRRAS